MFLRRFTEADAAAWEDAWKQAHTKHDAAFNVERSRLCAEYGPRIVAGDTPALSAILHDLEAAGLRRQLPDWKQADPPRYPRGVGMTTVGKPRWAGEATDKKRPRELRKQYEEAWTDEVGQKADALARELRAALRKVDADNNAALWREVRELFNYPVFTAAPKAVGIESTGAEGPNQLPDVLAAYRKFSAWVQAGANADQTPEFGA